MPEKKKPAEKKPAAKATDKDKALAPAIAALSSILINLQIPLTPALQEYVRKAAEQQIGSTQFLIEFRKTKAYAQRFPGIVRKDGTLRMSEAQYISGYNSAVDAAGSVGRPFSREMYGVALANNNSPSEIRAKIGAVDKLRTYAPQFQEFNDYLLTTGQIKKPLTRGELLEFALGQRKDFEQLWQTANSAFRLQEQAGVNVDRPAQGGDVSYKELTSMVKRFQALGGDVEQVDFKKMGALISDVIPKSELYGAGITKRDIVGLMLEGKNAPEIATRVQRVLDTYEAAVTEAPAHAPGYAGRVQQGTPRRSSE